MTRHSQRHMAAAAALAASAMAAPGLAHANDSITAKYSGFGTFGVVNSSANSSQYRSAATQYRGAGAEPEFGVDSRGGAQADVQFNDMLSATGQLLTVRRGTHDFRPDVEWLFGQAKLPYGFNVRVGRMGVPAYMVSDFRQVGYATPWIRPPVEVYSGMMYHRFDGAQIVYRKSIGEYNLTVQPSIGKSEAQVRSSARLGPTAVDIDIHLETDEFWGLNALLERGDWTARWGTVRSDAKANVNSLSSSPISGFIPTWPRIATGSLFKDNFSGYGLQYDDGKLLVMAEYVTRRSVQNDTDGHYITAAYRWGDWAPYVTLAGLKDEIKVTASTPVGSLVKSQSRTLGVRWNVAKNTSLKTQYDFVETNGVAFITPPADKARIFSLAVDFVF